MVYFSFIYFFGQMGLRPHKFNVFLDDMSDYNDIQK